MTTPDKDLRDLVAAEAMAAEIAAGDYVIGETLDADLILPRTNLKADTTLVVTTVRLTVDQRRRTQALAEQRGVDVATLIRGWVDEGLADAEGDRKISLADLKRVIAGLPPAA